MHDRLALLLAGPAARAVQGPLHDEALKVGEVVQVVGMAEADDCMSEIFVFVRYGDFELAVPLGQLECQSGDEATCEAVADWHYWVERGYEYRTTVEYRYETMP